MSAEQVYIGIGSNLGDPASNVRGAVELLAKVSDSELIEYSSLYQSEPLGDIAQDDYVNAVAALKTSLQPAVLLLELQTIERYITATAIRRYDGVRGHWTSILFSMVIIASMSAA